MSQKKQAVRQAFRDAVFKRDRYACRCCSVKSTPEKAKEELDAHHIQNRNLFKNGGYVKQNGISLCPECHLKAEQFHQTGISAPGYSPEELYAKIGSSKELAEQADAKL